MPGRRTPRRGIALLLVVIFSFVLAGVAAILWHSASVQRPQREFITEKKQAEYLARGAQQHFLLKFRYLPTELYDAIAYAIGKNPYYDFGRRHSPSCTAEQLAPEDVEKNPGPMFYFGRIREFSIDPATGVPRIRREVDLDNPAPGLSGKKIKYLLKMYLLDVSTMYPTDDLDGIVVINSAPHEDLAMGSGWRDPFVGNYAVQDATILGLASGKRYDKDSLLVTTLGSVKRAGQISLVTLGPGGEPRNLSMGRRRISELKYGVNEFPEASEYFESMEEWNKRMAEDAAGAGNRSILGLDGTAISSGRRTEIATGIYQVERKTRGSP